MRKIKVALVQFESKNLDVNYNISKAIRFINQAAEQNADLIVFPELFLTGYNMDLIGNQYYELAEGLNGEIVSILQKQALHNNINIVAPIAFQDEVPGVIYNSAIVINRNGEINGVYHKTHLWADEKLYFKEGTDLPVFEMDFGRIGIMICYDGGFPEVSRTLALKGAELILCPSAFPVKDKYMWDIYFKSRALENACFVASTNCVGNQNISNLFGNNKLVNPNAEVLLEGKINCEEMQVEEIDMDLVKEYRKRNPFLRDLKPEIYVI